MYTSFVSAPAQADMGQSKGFRNRCKPNEIPTKETLTAEFDNNQLLRLNQRILDGKAVVTKVLHDTSYVIYHEDFRREFVISRVPDQEDIKTWVKLQTHSNVITAFDSFIEQTSGCQFVMTEANNGGTMFNYIKEFGEERKMDLAIDVPRSYIELVFDVAIQLATGLDFAHNNGLIHGQFDLSKVFLERDGNNIMYKVGEFSPQTSMDLPVSTEANYWPFSKQKKEISDREKQEVIMLKDIYSLGIAILELMIGRTSKQKFHISLESLPLTWAEFPESTPLIQVLVECIQIDSITQRKGKLASIRKLLIREYKKFFQKQCYKMEHPYVGKKADVFNKRGIVALFHGKEGEAIRLWSEARTLSDRHFDSAANFCIYKWSTGRCSDENLMKELGQFVFDVPGKGEVLHAYLKIATGEREEGLKILKTFLDDPLKEREKGGVSDKNKDKKKQAFDWKLRRMIEQAETVYNTVKMEKDTFSSNATVLHTHKEKVQHMSFCEDGGYFGSICLNQAKVWKVAQSLMGCFCTINSKDQQAGIDANAKQLIIVDNSGTQVVIYRGYMQLYVYKIVEKGQDRIAEQKDTIDIIKEIKANGNPEFQFDSRDDQVMDMRFLPCESPEQTHFRIYLMVSGQHYFADVSISDGCINLRRANLFEDKSVLGETEDTNGYLKKRQDTLKTLIIEQMNAGNDLLFPSQDNRIVVVKVLTDTKQNNHDNPPVENGEEHVYKYYHIFDIARDSYIRLVQKTTNMDDAAAVNQNGTLLVYHEKDQFVIKSIRVPNSAALIDRLRPRFCVAENKLNPAKASSNRQEYKDKVYRELHAYHIFKEDPAAEKHLGLTEEQNVQLMVMRYEEAVMAQYKLKANRELMMLQKVLLRDAYKIEKQGDLQQHCPLIGVEGVKRVEIYDTELKFASNNARIEYVQMSSEPHRHFFLIGMQNRVYKYDVVTKELLFSFHSDFDEGLERFRCEQLQIKNKLKKLQDSPEEEIHLKQQLIELESSFRERDYTPIKNAMLLWDKDDKLICVSEEEIRLWDFHDHVEQAPELLTLTQTKIKVEAVYINKGHDHEKSPLLVCITQRNKFCLYITVKTRQKPIQEIATKNRKKKREEDEVLRYTYQLPMKLEDTLKEDDGFITTVAFSKPTNKPGSTLKMLVGTSVGRVITYNIESGERFPAHFQAGELDQQITQLTCLHHIPEDEVFLMTVDNMAVKLYNYTKQEVKAVDFGPEGENYEHKPICNVRVASNNKFFMVGVPGERAFGWFGLNRTHLTTRALKWTTKYQFKDMITDDHLSTMMLQDANDKQLDYFYILWKFATENIPDKKMLERMDGAPSSIATEDDDVTAGDEDGTGKAGVEKVTGSACCSIF